MSSLSIKIEQFEGPLDLLLHLIQINKYDIFDIPIVSITDQYLAVLGKMQEFDVEVATEFLLMASTLLQIKSRMLLPKLPAAVGEEDEQDPRALLAEMLEEYRKTKVRAGLLVELKQVADKQLARMPLYLRAALTLPQYTLGHLFVAWMGLFGGTMTDVAYIAPQAFSVEEKMRIILERLNGAAGGLLLNDFFVTGRPEEKIAAFLGVLELLKADKIRIEQRQNFAPIYIFAGRAVADGI